MPRFFHTSRNKYDFHLYLAFYLTAFVLQSQIHHCKRRHRLSPGPWNLPIIGSLHHFIFSGLPHRAVSKLSQRYGPIMFLQIGKWPTIIISSREAARMIFRTNEVTFLNRPDLLIAKIIFSKGGKDVGLSQYSEYWREIRRIITLGLLSPRRVQSFRSIREEEVLDLIQVISSMSSCNQTINLSEIFPVVANKVSVRTITGRKWNEEKHVLMVNGLKLSNVLSAGFCFADLFPSSRVIRLMSAQG